MRESRLAILVAGLIAVVALITVAALIAGAD